ncbi:hypothetical protein Y1Q_0003884 [Alligator mississippiensis]|uniref:Uncharacterized protein n=1 Tax=Alligator mississippiensis TaxID=8496 RepID=A0A151MNP9_ALLMI|nr:hypothetical protein Y1Q_0003884 [Alligator mississippiensis]
MEKYQLRNFPCQPWESGQQAEQELLLPASFPCVFELHQGRFSLLWVHPIIPDRDSLHSLHRGYPSTGNSSRACGTCYKRIGGLPFLLCWTIAFEVQSGKNYLSSSFSLR